jgi:hypothetical protein
MALVKKVVQASIPPAGQIYHLYYYSGGQRVAMREITTTTNVVYYLFTDHLGSTNVIADAQGNKVSELRY